MFVAPVTRSSAILSRSLDRLFNVAVERLLASAAADGRDLARGPALDVAETDAQYTVTIDLPGLSKEDIKVSIEGRQVSIEAQTKKDEQRQDGARVVFRERSASSFSSKLNLPGEVDQQQSEGKLENGVLRLTLVKLQPRAAARLTIN